MTKYKEYLRTRGVPLECDYPWLPNHELQGITPFVSTDFIGVMFFYTGCKFVQQYDRCGGCTRFEMEG